MNQDHTCKDRYTFASTKLSHIKPRYAPSERKKRKKEKKKAKMHRARPGTGCSLACKLLCKYGHRFIELVGRLVEITT